MDKNALIVDDSRLACKIMANMLESLNIRTLAVYSAEDALEHLKNNLPDIIFLDHTMPGMDGLEMIKLIKSNPKTATVPVLMYTAKQGDVYVSQARALGAVDVLPKGMEKNYLIKALRKLGFIDERKSKEPENNKPENEAVPEEVIEIQEKPDKKENQPPIDGKSDWKSFWEKDAEPFLYGQRKLHSDDIKYSNRQQTITLKREIHQTLEQFEHALIGRLESHEDLKNSQDEISKYKFNRFVSIFAVIVIVLQAGIFWQLYKENQLNEQLFVFYGEHQKKLNRLEQQLTDIKQPTTIIEQPPEVETGNTQTETETVQSISLVDNFGGVIASNLYLNDSDKEEYIGTTNTGYLFVVNTAGQVGWPLENRYFLTTDCSGDVFVSSENARIYRNTSGNIWYVDKLALPTEVAVGSKLNELDECLPADDEVLNLKPLERDYQFETGIDESLTLSLIIVN